MLRNLPVQHCAEAAIAGAQLLPHLPNAVELLHHNDAIQALVGAFLEEHSASDIDTIAGLQLASWEQMQLVVDMKLAEMNVALFGSYADGSYGTACI